MAYGITGPASKKGLFGKKFDPLAYSTGIGDDLKIQHSPEQRQAQQPAPEPQKPGFFGKGGTGRAIAGTIGDYLMQQQGMDPVYAPTMMMQQQQEAAARQAQLQRAQELGDWRWKEDYKAKNETRKPYRFEANDGDVYELGADGQPVKIFDDPSPRMQMVMGPDGRPYFINPNGQGAAPSAPVGKLTPISGGPTASQSGGF